MKVRHILGTALFCGAIGTLGGRTAQAQVPPPKSVAFVQVLLSQELKNISSDVKAMNTRNQQILKLNSLSPNSSASRRVTKSLNKLQKQILSMTTKLAATSLQNYNYAVFTSGRTSALAQQALAYLKTVQLLSVADGLGIMPATPTS